MTVQEIREAAKVMEAYANGKKIQYLNDDNEWIDAPNPLFDWDNCVYRIKPQLNKNTVFVKQRNNVRNRGKPRKGNILHCSFKSGECVEQFKGNARTAED